MKKITTRIYLIIAGALMLFIGAYIAIMTNEYVTVMTAENTELGVNLLSDIRGMGGMLFSFGIVLIVSQYNQPWHHSGIIIATVIYTSFVLFRSLGILIDGFPDFLILVAYSIELLMAFIGLYLLLRAEAEKNK